MIRVISKIPTQYPVPTKQTLRNLDKNVISVYWEQPKMYRKSLCIFHGVYIERRIAILQATVQVMGATCVDRTLLLGEENTKCFAKIHHFRLPNICEFIQALYSALNGYINTTCTSISKLMATMVMVVVIMRIMLLITMTKYFCLLLFNYRYCFQQHHKNDVTNASCDSFHSFQNCIHVHSKTINFIVKIRHIILFHL